jgi:acyl carrier protein
MSNKEKLIGVFVSALGIAAEVAESAVFKETSGWDSVGHVNLMNEIEEAFDVSLEPDDILDFKSFKDGVEILKKNGIEF